MDFIIMLLCFVATIAISLRLDVSEFGIIGVYFLVFTVGIVIIMIKDGYDLEDIIMGLKEWISDWFYHLKVAAIFGLILLVIGFALSSPRVPPY